VAEAGLGVDAADVTHAREGSPDSSTETAMVTSQIREKLSGGSSLSPATTP
jgi:hypothetical protein